MKNLHTSNLTQKLHLIFSYILTLFILTFFHSAYAQSPEYFWAKSAGGSNTDEGYSVATDAGGNILVTGSFYSSSITFGTTTLNNTNTSGNSDMFLVKYDESGNVLWAKSAGGNSPDEGLSVATDANENILVFGEFSSSSITFGSITLNNKDTAGYRPDIFLVKYDASGNVLWAKSAGGNDIEGGRSVTTDTSGNILVTGFFKSPSITFGTKLLNNTGSFYQDMFIVKYDNSGNVLWAKSAGGNSPDEGLSVATDADENILVFGEFSSPSITFGTTTLNNADTVNSDMFLVKYDGSGNVLWAKSAGGNDIDGGRSVTTDAVGNILVTGYFYSPSITFGTKLLNNTGSSADMFLVKYDSGGNVLWAKSAGGNSFDGGRSVTTDADGNILVTGNFRSPFITFETKSLNNADTTGNYSNMFLVKYDGSGNVLWVKSAGGNSYDGGNSVITDAVGNILVTGYFYSSYITFGTTTLNNAGTTGRSDLFIVKLIDKGVYGFVFNDLNSNCQKDTNELVIIQNAILTVNPGNIVVQTNSSGNWFIHSLPVGNYIITAHSPGTWLPTCPQTQSFSVTDPEIFSTAPPFGFISTLQCPDPTVSVNAPFLRRCFSNQNIYVNVCNKSTATGALNNAYIVLKIDSLLIPQSSTIPFTNLGDGNLRFNIGNLNPGICTQFSVACSVSCNTMIGQTLCMKANLYPADSCVFDTITVFPTGVSPCTLPWDKSSLKVEGSCVDDSIGFKAMRFVVYNTGEPGSGDMQCYSPVRIYTDAVIVKLDSVKLKGGDSAVFVFAGDGKTWRLEADQHPKHPGNSHPNATIEACGGTINWTPGLINSLAMDDADPVVDIYCGVVTGSYDPNDKAGYPTGSGANQNVMPNQKMEYTIRFQNTGNDTAFTVIIRDTLDLGLNIASVNSGASSHNYTFRMYGKRVLEWTFNNILLPDSNVNEPASHGFVTFSVNQISNLSNDTKIKNTADIYFDYNAPVRTNTVTHTIKDNIQNITVSLKNKQNPKNNSIRIYPNPAEGNFLFDFTANKPGTINISIYDMMGKKLVEQKEYITSVLTKQIDLSVLQKGMYILKVEGNGVREMRKVVVQ